MAAKKISQLNDELDFKLLVHIVVKNLRFIIPLFFFALIFSFLFLRYTQPLYEASTVIQLNNENQASKVFTTSNSYYSDDLSEKVEQLKSTQFLKRALGNLPLGVSYFVEGNVLDFELYKNSPFIVSAELNDDFLYGKQIALRHKELDLFSISYNYNSVSYEFDVEVGKRQKMPGMSIVVDYNDFVNKDNIESIFESKEKLFFIINNPETIYNKYIANIRIGVHNEASNTVKVVVEDYNAQRAMDIANVIAEEYKIYDVEKKAVSANNVLDFIDEQLSVVYENLFVSERKLDSFKRKNNIDSSITKPVPTIYSQISKYEEAVVNLEFEEMLLSRFQQDLNQEDIDTYELFAIISGSEFQGSISDLLNSLQETLIKKEQLLYNVTESSGQIEAINYQIEVQKKLLFEAVVNFKKNVSQRKVEMLRKLNQYEAQLIPDSKDYNSMEYSRLERIYSINEKFYNQLIEKKTEYSITKAGYVSQNIILETAYIPSAPIFPSKKLIILGSLMVAFLISLIILVLNYLFYNSITSVNDIKKYSDISILGIVPKYKLKIPVSQLVVDSRPKSLVAESLRAIRTNLQFVNNEEGSKIISITSTISGEGKTFIAINLAGVIAFSNKKVLLIDFDMRKPKIHLGFGSDNRKGTSTILSNRDSIEDCIKNSSMPNLDFITAGPVPPNPSELMLTKEMTSFIEEVKTKYDYVIIDNPPIGLVADAMKTIQLSDYPIYVMKANYSKRMFIQNVERLYHENNLKNISCVLNAVDSNLSSYASGKGRHSFGYGYSQAYGGYYDTDEEEFELANRKWYKNIFKKK